MLRFHFLLVGFVSVFSAVQVAVLAADESVNSRVSGVTPHVELLDSSMKVDGEAVPFLYGADVQYFRARGGSGRNVPAAKVHALWEKMIDRVLEAKMNVVNIYIPWDFHEPEEGVFDFDGKLDRDGDGNPDYPSRNLKGFLKMLESRGIHRIILRPGPYINAEWGPTGFGAVPGWFIDHYPQALATTLTPNKPRTASFAHPIFQSHVVAWFTALYQQVLKDEIGPGKPAIFLQLDNETNYFWDSVYERDRNPEALKAYHQFLQKTYHQIGALNESYVTQLKSFDDVVPPTSPKDLNYEGKSWHYDWYHFHDVAIRDYYKFLRTTWENLGVHEPDIIFTSCESYNVLNHGLLPRLDYRGTETFTSMNIYPKTAPSEENATLNQPMKAAHDVAIIAAGHRQFFKNAANWVLSTETQSGWFPPVPVSMGSREHTYGSLMGAGLKAMIIYYFHEGYNWTGKEKTDSELHFDAPIDKDMNPRAPFALIKKLGETLQAGLGATLLHSQTASSKVLLAHDVATQYPLPGERDAAVMASTESAALYGYFRELGATPDLGYLDAMTPKELQAYRLIIWNHPGYASQNTISNLKQFVAGGGTVLWIGTQTPELDASPNVLWWKSNLAEDWNTDNYATLVDISPRLAKGLAVLHQAGIVQPLLGHAEDGLHQLHFSTRSVDSTHTLLFVENFLGAERKIQLDVKSIFNRAQFGDNHYISVKRVFGLSAVPQPFTVETRTAGNLPVPVSADSVDIWEISLTP